MCSGLVVIKTRQNLDQCRYGTIRSPDLLGFFSFIYAKAPLMLNANYFLVIFIS